MSLPDDPRIAVQELARRYPGWIIRRSDIGRVWANCRDASIPSGCSATLDADTPDELDALLFEQERRRSRTPPTAPRAAVGEAGSPA